MIHVLALAVFCVAVAGPEDSLEELAEEEAYQCDVVAFAGQNKDGATVRREDGTAVRLTGAEVRAMGDAAKRRVVFEIPAIRKRLITERMSRPAPVSKSSAGSLYSPGSMQPPGIGSGRRGSMETTGGLAADKAQGGGSDPDASMPTADLAVISKVQEGLGNNKDRNRVAQLGRFYHGDPLYYLRPPAGMTPEQAELRKLRNEQRDAAEQQRLAMEEQRRKLEELKRAQEAANYRRR